MTLTKTDILMEKSEAIFIVVMVLVITGALLYEWLAHEPIPAEMLCPSGQCEWEGVLWYYDHSDIIRGFALRKIENNTSFKYGDLTPWGKCGNFSPDSPGGYCLILYTHLNKLGIDLLMSIEYPDTLPNNLP